MKHDQHPILIQIGGSSHSQEFSRFPHLGNSQGPWHRSQVEGVGISLPSNVRVGESDGIMGRVNVQMLPKKSSFGRRIPLGM